MTEAEADIANAREIYLPSELRVSRHAAALAPPVRTHHIWCSRHNPGALEVVNELKHAGGYEGRLLVTEEPGAMAEADHVLLYLSLATWADDGQRKTELTAEIRGALQAGRKLLLVHETDENKGGAPLDRLRSECAAEVRQYVFGSEASPSDVIPWHRISDFQLVSLRLTRAQSGFLTTHSLIHARMHSPEEI